MFDLAHWYAQSAPLSVGPQWKMVRSERTGHAQWNFAFEFQILERHRHSQRNLQKTAEPAFEIFCVSFVDRFTANGVEFDDGSVEDDIDVVIFATGYKFGYPFLPGGVVEVRVCGEPCSLLVNVRRKLWSRARPGRARLK